MLRQHVFGLLYRLGDRVYDPLVRVLYGDEWARWRRTVLPYVRDGEPVLDLGCGTGQLLVELQRLGSKAVGVDRSTPMLRAARRRLGLCSPVACGDAAALPLPSGTFGTVVATFPAPFILEAATADEIVRVLRPGGRLVVAIGGTVERWTKARQPIRMPLTLFYGGQRRRSAPDSQESPLIAHALLHGTWHDAPTENGRARLWVATRLPEEGVRRTGRRDETSSVSRPLPERLLPDREC